VVTFVYFVPIALIHAAEAAVLRRALPVPLRLNTLRQTLLFLLLGPLAGSVVAAALVEAFLWAIRFSVPPGTLLRAMFLTSMLGQITLAPPILLAAEAFARNERRWQAPTAARAGEALALAASLLLVGQIAFGELLPNLAPSPALVYAPLPLLLWAAVRFGTGGVGLAVLAVAVQSTWNAMRGRGPFVMESPDANVLTLQVFLLAISTPLLALAALVREREHSTAMLGDRERELRHRFAQLSAVYRDAPVGLAFLDTGIRYVNVNDRLAEMRGASADTLVGRTPREVLPEMADAIEARYRRVLASGAPNVDLETHGTTPSQPGVERDWLVNDNPVRDE
jgi:PAS domain S-box-containing protein